MEHAERYDTKGSCGRARTTHVVEREGRHIARETHHHMYLACGIHHHIMRNHPLKQSRDLKYIYFIVEDLIYLVAAKSCENHLPRQPRDKKN
jgi:hypothetical protein